MIWLLKDIQKLTPQLDLWSSQRQVEPATIKVGRDLTGTMSAAISVVRSGDEYLYEYSFKPKTGTLDLDHLYFMGAQSSEIRSVHGVIDSDVSSAAIKFRTTLINAPVQPFVELISDMPGYMICRNGVSEIDPNVGDQVTTTLKCDAGLLY